MSIKVKVGGSKSIRAVPKQDTNRSVVATGEKRPSIVEDSVALGFDTTGNYVATLDAGDGIVVVPETNTESAALVVRHANTSSELASSNNDVYSFLTNINIDNFGHTTLFQSKSFNTSNFDSSNNVISSQYITFGNTSVTLGDTTDEIIGLTNFNVGDLTLTGRSIIGDGNIRFAPSSGIIDANNSRFINAADPVDEQDLVTRAFVDNTVQDLTISLKIVEDPVGPTDATNKRYVDNVIKGLRVRPAVLAATTANLSGTFAVGNTTFGSTLTLPPTITLNIDDVTDWSIGDRLLIKDQSNSLQNGSYELIQAGTGSTNWIFQRTSHSDESDEVPGSFYYVTDGTANRSTGWVATVTDAETFDLNTDPVTFIQFQGEGTYTAGDGLSITGYNFAVNVDDYGIEINNDTLRLKDRGVTNAKLQNPSFILGTSEYYQGNTYNTISGLDTLELSNLNGIGGNIIITSDVVDVNSNGAIILPSGTTSERPTPYIQGMVRYNQTDGQFEGYDGSVWSGLGGVIDVDQDTKITAENTPGADNDELRFFAGGNEAAKFDASKNAYFYGDVDVTGNVTIGGNITIGDQTTDSIEVVADFTSNLIPDQDRTYNLGSATKNWDTLHVGTIQSNNELVVFDSTGSIQIPVGTTAERPSATQGQIRYNTTDGQFEGYDGTAWAGLGGVIDVDQDTKITAENSPGADNDQLNFFVANTNVMRLDSDGDLKFGQGLNQFVVDYATGQITIRGNITIGDANTDSIVVTSEYSSHLIANTHNTFDLGSNTKDWRTLYVQNIAGQGDVLTIDSTGAVVMPVGSTADRPTAETGMLRFNTNDNRFEGYDGTNWTGIAGSVIDVDQDTRIIAETSPNADNDQLQFFTANTLAAQIDSDQTVKIYNRFVLPTGNTSQRYATSVQGSIRYNTEDNAFEGYDGSNWGTLGGVKDADQDTYIEAETSSGADNDELKFYTGGTEAFYISNTQAISTSGSANLVFEVSNKIDVSNTIITGLASPVNPTDAVSKNYLEEEFRSNLQVEDLGGGNRTLNVLKNPKLNLGTGLEEENFSAANNELTLRLSDLTATMTPGIYGNDGFTPRFRVDSTGRIDFATEIPVELQANAIPDFTETTRDIVSLMFVEGDHIGGRFVNDDANNTIAFELTANTIATVTANTGIEIIHVPDPTNGSLDIRHGNTSGVSDTNNITTTILGNITFDEFGHVQTVESRDLSPFFIPYVGDSTIAGELTFNKFIDANDTDFFVDPHADSEINNLLLGKNQTSSQLEMRDGNGTSSFLFAGNLGIGFLDSGFNFAAYTNKNTGDWTVKRDVIAERFVDTDDTNYFLHPAGTNSKLAKVTFDDSIVVDNITVDGNEISTSIAGLSLNPSNQQVSVNSSRIIDVADPTSNQDAATKAYVDAVAQGLRVIPAALVATTADLSATYNNSNGTLDLGPSVFAPTIDGVSISLNDRILVKDQTNAFENGSYIVTQAGNLSASWILTRGEYFNESTEIPGSFQFVTDGTQNNGTGYVAQVDDAETFTLGTDDINWYQFSGAGTYTAGAGLTLTGTEFSVSNNAITNAMLQNSTITIAGESGANQEIALGTTLTFDAGNGIDTSISSGQVSISANTSDIFASIKTVDGANSGLDADLLDGQEGTYYLDFPNFTNLPDPKIDVNVTGDVVGSGNTTLTDLTDGTININAELTDTGVTPGTYGSASQIPIVTVDVDGRITSMSNTAVAGVDDFTWDSSNNQLQLTTGDGSVYNIYLNEFKDLTVEDLTANSININTLGFDALDVAGDISANNIFINNLTVTNDVSITQDLSANNAHFRGDITVDGTVDGRDIAADGITLDNLAAATTTVQLNGDVTGSDTSNANGVITIATDIANSGVTPGTYGTSSQIPIVTVGLDGRITSMSNTAVAGVNDYFYTSANNTFTIQTGDGSVFNAKVNAFDENVDFGAGIDVTGNITVTGTVDGRDIAADGARLDQLEDDLTIQLNGDVTGTVTSNTGTLAITTDIANSGVTAGTYGSSSLVPVITVAADGRITVANTTAVAGVESVNWYQANNTLQIGTSDGSLFNQEISAFDQNVDFGAGIDVTGNVTVTGTVDGRDILADGQKLDTIETGATADQSNTEIFNAVTSLDGANSGLDADLLDGQEGSYYLNYVNFTNPQALLNTILTIDGDGSGIDADSVDGYSAGEILDQAANNAAQLIGDGEVFIYANTGVVIDGPPANRFNLNSANSFSFYVGHADTSSVVDTSLTLPNVVTGLTFDTFGHVQTVSSSNLDDRYYTETEADSIFVPQTTHVIAGDALTGGGALTANVTINHADTSTQGNVSLTGGNVVTGINVDTYGHVTDINSTDLDDRYYTETELDNGQLDSRYYTETELDNGQLDTRYYTKAQANTLFVDAAGDTMTGDLTVNANINQEQSRMISKETSASNTFPLPVLQFAHADYGSAEVVITAKDGSNRHVTKLLVTHDGTTAIATEFGVIYTSNELASYEVSISGSNCVVSATSFSGSTNYKIVATLLAA